MSAVVAFALASALHAGFQLTVSALVYPTLATRDAQVWAEHHARHTRGIAPVVVLVYGALVVTGAVLVADGPDAAGWCALGGGAAALALTAVGAAPLHSRLTARDDVLVRRLLVVDRWRCAAAVAGALAAVLAAAS
jgi:hypothetical protein